MLLKTYWIIYGGQRKVLLEIFKYSVLKQKKTRQLDLLINPGIKTRKKSDERSRSIFGKERDQRKKIAFWESSTKNNLGLLTKNITYNAGRLKKSRRNVEAAAITTHNHVRLVSPVKFFISAEIKQLYFENERKV